VEKSQGITIATVLAAAVLTHPGGGPHPAFNAAQAMAKIPGIRAEGDGPWFASCQYWAPDRLAGKDEPYKPDTVWTAAKGGYLEFNRQPETECGADTEKRWGFPAKIATVEPAMALTPQNTALAKKAPKAKLPKKRARVKSAASKRGSNTAVPQITAIIATVPDPVHTNMALQFDRYIDSLIEAAEDNGYLSSYYWLPWNNERKKTETEESNEPNVANEEEKQPGLIIFKHWSRPSDPKMGPTVGAEDFESVLYLFLVGETPTSGINAYQMERALEIEGKFASYGASCKIGFRRSLKVPLKQASACIPSRTPPPDQLSIIGPIFSGAAVSLRRTIDEELCRHPEINSASVRGITSTVLALNQMNYSSGSVSFDGSPGRTPCGSREIVYKSFAANADYDQRELDKRFGALRISQSRVTVLVEDDTTLGHELNSPDVDVSFRGYTIRFPRGISLLRNAKQSDLSTDSPSSPPSPYLHLSLKGSNISDSLPHFSGELSALSQEAQLMAIEHQLKRYRTKYIVISATDVLDELFLAQFLHRVIPDAHMVFDGGDLLFEREVDDVPFIGAITIGPYPLLDLSSDSQRGKGSRAFADWSSEASYNAASSTFWPEEPTPLIPYETAQRDFPLAGYQDTFEGPDSLMRPKLWLTLVGSDGYYPLGIESQTPSNRLAILPEIPHSPCPTSDPCQKPIPLPIRPPLAWAYLCGIIFLFCLLHSLLISIASYWSPMTRDIDVARNDQPHRRALYINIGAVMLFGMAFVGATPYAFAQGLIISDSFSRAVAIATLVSGLIVLLATGLRTLPYFWPPNNVEHTTQIKFFNLITLATLVSLVVFWTKCLGADNYEAGTHAGQFFAYRCLNPTSRVSPVVPVVMLLFGWYFWAIYQTLRLRFSECNRPVVPGVLQRNSQRSFVADWQLKRCAQSNDPCLYSNIECLLITLEVVQRFFIVTEVNKRRAARWTLAVIYFAAFATLTYFWAPLHSVDEILLGNIPSMFRFLIAALFFPLLMIAVSGWIRMIMIWGSMKRDLLQRIENQPLRFAFSRIKNPGWMSMLRQSGLREHWRDISRSIESVQQLINGLEGQSPTREFRCMCRTRDAILGQAQALRRLVDSKPVSANAPKFLRCATVQNNLNQREGLLRMATLERKLAQFGEQLLDYVLIPYWSTKRTGLVESAIPLEEKSGEKKEKSENKASSLDLRKEDPPFIQAAEEFVTIRYVSLIRAVLVNLRYQMFFVGLTFIVTIAAWNAYPFQPRQVIDWLFTALLLLLGGGVVVVLAQMYRDPLLSRITATTPNELGFEFWLRLTTVGALPILTWLAYQFPDVGGAIFKVFQSGSEVVK
jgi:hypothetical protein